MKTTKTDQEWKEILPEDVYKITRERGTEHAFSGKYDKFYEDGNYYCSNCANHLFSSNAKYDSGSGWPSFYDPASKDSLDLKIDPAHGLVPQRTEVICKSCDAHLGHVFPDGPKPTGQRYCMNSLGLVFKPTK